MNARVMLLLMFTALFAAMCWTDASHTPNAARRLDRQLARRNAMHEIDSQFARPLQSRWIAVLPSAESPLLVAVPNGIEPLALNGAGTVRLVSDLRPAASEITLARRINLQWEELGRSTVPPACVSECLWHRGGCSFQRTRPQTTPAVTITRRAPSPLPSSPAIANAVRDAIGPCDIVLPAEMAAGEYRVTDNFGRVLPLTLSTDDLSYHGVRTGRVPQYWYLSEHDSRQWLFFRVTDALHDVAAAKQRTRVELAETPVAAPQPRWQSEFVFEEPCDAHWLGGRTPVMAATNCVIVDAAVEAPQPAAKVTVADLAANDRWLPSAEDDVDEDDELERMPISWIVRPQEFLVMSPQPAAAIARLDIIVDLPVEAPHPVSSWQLRDIALGLMPALRPAVLSPLLPQWQMTCWQCARRSDRIARRMHAWQRQMAAELDRLAEQAATAGRPPRWTERLSSEPKAHDPN